MTVFIKLSEEEFESFITQQPHVSFMQSLATARRRVVDGWNPHFVGIKDNDTVVGAALLQSRRVFGKFADFECQQGPILDYENVEHLECILHGIKDYGRTNDALQVRLNPPILAVERDADAQIIGTYSGAAIEKIFLDCQYNKLPSSYVDATPSFFRWFFVKPLDPTMSDDELLNSFDQQTRWSIRKSQKMGVTVRKINRDELETFESIVQKTATRRGFKERHHDYYTSMLDEFGDAVEILVAEIDTSKHYLSVKQLLDEQEAKARTLESAISTTPDDKKLHKQLKVAKELITTYSLQLKKAAALKKQAAVIPIAGAMFLQHSDEMSYLISGALTDYSQFNGPYALQWAALRKAHALGLKRYNFYGTHGNFSGHPEQHGVYLFKKGFGGVVEEQLGFYVYTARPFTMMLRTIAGNARKLLRR